MPGGDRTGPQGAGPRTGHGMGYCGNYDRLGFANPPAVVRGRFGFGSRGAGRGWRHRFYATGITGWAAPTAEQETANLKAQAEFLQSQLDAIQKRIEELESKQPE
jgi:hydrogenase maturation factor HypE